MRRGQAGFTVIEVMIVLSIAGLMLLGAFAAMSSSIASTRFTDTMTTTQSYFQKQYLEVATGKNARDNSLTCNRITGAVSAGSSTAGGSDCILMGRQLTVNGSQVTSKYIVGVEPAVKKVYVSDTEAVRDYSPKTITALASSFDIPWGASVQSIRRSGAAVPYISIIRSPQSERILVYSNATPQLDNVTLTAASLNQAVDACINSGDGMFARTGHMMIGAGQGQDLFMVERVGTAAC